MCVIVTAEKGNMPTIDQLTRMSETNPDGAGIAWHDGNGLHRVRHSDNGKTLAFITEHWNELKALPPERKNTSEPRQESHRLPRTPTSATPGTRPDSAPAGGDGGWGGPERPPVPGLQPPPRHGPSDVPTLPIRRTGERLMERQRDGRVRGRGTITRAATTRRNHRRAAWGPRRPARRRPPAAARTTPSAREAHNPGRAPPNRNRRRTSRA